MITTNSFILVNNIKLPIHASEKEAFSVAKRKLRSSGIKVEGETYSVYKRSVDARKKDNIFFVWSISISGAFDPTQVLASQTNDVSVCEYSHPSVEYGHEKLEHSPVVIGAGPCGLFAALILAENGYKPIIIERGGSVKERQEAVKRLNTEHILDVDTNVQFGAGGAGTFSDGKLVTRINDPLCNYVLEKFVEFGAPSDIKYIAKPHVGTDYLCRITDNIINKIVSLGGSILYNTKYLGNIEENLKVKAVRTTSGDIPTDAVILAVGHSARDVYGYLISRGHDIKAKSFSVGMRIENTTQRIDEAFYGKFAGDKRLGHAEYNLSYDTKNRGVYTFCMCPGGYVVAATSEEYGVVVNGMSERARDGRNSNSAIVCSVFPDDYGNTPNAAIEYQRTIEKAAYRSTGGGYAAPIVTVGDFLEGKAAAEPTDVIPTYMGGNNCKIVSPDQYLTETVTKSIRGAIANFNSKIKGFAPSSAILTGAETRTSSPVRIVRNNESRATEILNNFYPAGEGAGYAGGITSAAIDGLKTALTVMKRYKPIGE